jgi:hypothetical protein
MFEPECDERLVRLRHEAALPRRLPAIQQQLRHLLRDRGRPLDDTAFGEVRAQRPRNRNRIDAHVAEEPPVLGGKCRRDEPRGSTSAQRNARVASPGVPRRSARRGGPDHGGGCGRLGQQRLGQRPAAHPQDQATSTAPAMSSGRRRRAPRGEPRAQARGARVWSQTPALPLHVDDGRGRAAEDFRRVISSTRAGAVRKVPAVVARTM